MSAEPRNQQADANQRHHDRIKRALIAMHPPVHEISRNHRSEQEKPGDRKEAQRLVEIRGGSAHSEERGKAGDVADEPMSAEGSAPTHAPADEREQEPVEISPPGVFGVQLMPEHGLVRI